MKTFLFVLPLLALAFAHGNAADLPKVPAKSIAVLPFALVPSEVVSAVLPAC